MGLTRLILFFSCIILQLLISGCDSTNSAPSQVYHQSVQVVNSHSDTLFLNMKRWGLTGNHNAFCISERRNGADCFEYEKNFIGVDIIFYRVSNDTLEILLEHQLPIKQGGYNNWFFKQRTINGTQFRSLLISHDSLGYKVLK